MWTEFNGMQDKWDSMILSFDNYHPTHCYSWGNLHGHERKIYRLVFTPATTQKPTAAIQIVYRTLAPGFHYFRSEGGLAGDLGSIGDLKLFITEETGGYNWYLRIFSRSSRGAQEIASLQSSLFNPPISRIHTGLTAGLVLQLPYTGQYSSNWKHNLSRAKKRSLSVKMTHTISPTGLTAIYRELELVKNIGEQFAPAEIQVITEAFGSNLIAAEVRAASGELLSIRAAIILGEKAFDLIAATNNQGRTSYASNLALHSLLEACANKGVQSYDFAGIDPEHGKGVMNFKLGTGATPLEYVGEWDFSPRNWIRLLANAVLYIKLRSKMAKANSSSKSI